MVREPGFTASDAEDMRWKGLLRLAECAHGLGGLDDGALSLCHNAAGDGRSTSGRLLRGGLHTLVRANRITEKERD